MALSKYNENLFCKKCVTVLWARVLNLLILIKSISCVPIKVHLDWVYLWYAFMNRIFNPQVKTPCLCTHL
jgi:hypothetical protein